MYYNVFIVEGIHNGFWDPDSIMEGMKKLHLVDTEMKFSIEPTLRDFSDGSQWVVEDTLKFSCGSLNVTKQGYHEMQDAWHNRLCSVMFFDPHDLTRLMSVKLLRLKIYVVAETQDVVRIRLEGERKVSPTLNPWYYMEYESLLNMGGYSYVDGRVYSAAGQPLPNAYVWSAVMGGNMMTDSDGFFCGILPSDSEELLISLTGHTFEPLPLSLAIGQPLTDIEIHATWGSGQSGAYSGSGEDGIMGKEDGSEGLAQGEIEGGIQGESESGDEGSSEFESTGDSEVEA